MTASTRVLARQVIDDHRVDGEMIATALMRLIQGQHGDQLARADVDEAEVSRSGASAKLHNYPGRGFRHMTDAAWHNLPRGRRGFWQEIARESDHAPHQVRVALTQDSNLVPIYLVDVGRSDPPSRGAASRPPRA